MNQHRASAGWMALQIGLAVSFASLVAALYGGDNGSRFPTEILEPTEQQTAPEATLDAFQQRLALYLEMRREIDEQLEPLRPLPSAAELTERQNRHAEAVRQTRMKQDIPRLVPDAAAAQIRSMLEAFFASEPSPPPAEQPIDLLPSGHPPVVNGRYFSYVPLSSIPPQLLADLPTLPDPLQYRFHGDYLMVLDAELALVVDVIADALPPYGGRAKAPPRDPRLLESTDAVPADGIARFAVVGDSGTGGRAQRLVAEQLVTARKRFPFEFVLMLGDNLYGDEDPDDYIEKFAAPYAPLLEEGVTFHAALGNHDEPAQAFYAPFNMNGRRYYTFRRGPVEFFVLDSTYMPPAQVQWLRESLAASDAPWKVATMHHPIYSTGRRHGASEDLRALLEPVFIEHGVDLVLAGHEHFYERLAPQHGIHYLTSGSAAKLREGNVQGGPQTLAHFDEGYSFLLMRADKDELTFEAVSADGRVVDSGRLRPRTSRVNR